MLQSLIDQLSTVNPLALILVLVFGAGSGTVGTSAFMSTTFATEAYVDFHIKWMDQKIDYRASKEEKRDLEEEIFNLTHQAESKPETFTSAHARRLNEKVIRLQEVKESINIYLVNKTKKEVSL